MCYCMLINVFYTDNSALLYPDCKFYTQNFSATTYRWETAHTQFLESKTKKITKKKIIFRVKTSMNLNEKKIQNSEGAGKRQKLYFLHHYICYQTHKKAGIE